MPGLSLYHSFAKQPGTPSSKCHKVQQEMLHGPDYTSKTLLDNDSTYFGFTKHHGYDVEVFENQEFLICLDGTIYGKSPSGVTNELFDLAHQLADDHQSEHSSLVNWLKGTDGEFVLFFWIKRSGKFAILNDLWGVLPLYYRISENSISVSREARFILRLQNEIKFDRLSLAQHLLMGWNPHQWTIFKGLNRFPPASLLTWGLEAKPQMRNIYQYNFEQEDHAGRTIQENTRGFGGSLRPMLPEPRPAY